LDLVSGSQSGLPSGFLDQLELGKYVEERLCPFSPRLIITVSQVLRAAAPRIQWSFPTNLETLDIIILNILLRGSFVPYVLALHILC